MPIRYCLPVRELSHRDGARSADAVTPPSAVRHVQLTKHCTGGYTTVYDDLITRAIRTQSVPLPHARAHTTLSQRRELAESSSTHSGPASDMPFHSE